MKAFSSLQSAIEYYRPNIDGPFCAFVWNGNMLLGEIPLLRTVEVYEDRELNIVVATPFNPQEAKNWISLWENLDSNRNWK